MSGSRCIPLGASAEIFEGFGFARCTNTAQKVLDLAVRLINEDNPGGDKRICASLSLLRARLEPLVLQQAFVWDWQSPNLIEKLTKYTLLSPEKANRLRHMFRAIGHRSSFLSRDPDRYLDGQHGSDPYGHWGGAIVCRIDTSLTPEQDLTILSLSGFPELWDEAAMLVLAIALGWMKRKRALANFSNDRNPHLRTLLAAWDKECQE